MALITAKDLALGYDREVIVSGLNFDVNSGDYLCIVGENGSGKTTLMKTLLSLMQPIEGKILTGDGLNANEIGYLPQQTQVQRDFPASVKEVVLSGCQGRCGLRPFYSRKEKELAKSNMERMRIKELENRSYRELSGGQQQRVLLARALCATQKVLLLDEPVSGLDPKVTAEMYELIKKLNSEGITIIMISHDIEAAVLYASHILHIGDEVFFGTKDDYLKSSPGQLFLMNRRFKNEVKEQGGDRNDR
ncbi:MAG: ABC transporter ATP-binding protein [Lachnospiraceae bacterium]|nr:ABC transporter ATP-binding protein [Lachnospiraceae bacterium]